MARKTAGPAATTTPDKDVLKDMLEDFKCCDEAEADQRRESLADLKFAKLNEQWDEQAKTARGADRPMLTINKLNTFIKQVTNDGRLNRPSIAVKPVGDGASKDTAKIQSDLIRNIETQSQAPVVYDTATEFAVSSGIGYFRVDVGYTHDDAWDQDIMLKRISNPFSVYGDWESTEATSIDWNRAFITDFYSKAAFEKRWKGAKAASFEVGGQDFNAQWFKNKQIRVGEWWTRAEVEADLLQLTNGAIMWAAEFLKTKDLLAAQGVTVKGTRKTRTFKVTQRLVTGTDVLETNDWLGKYIPIVPMYGEEVNVDGKRYFKSLIRDAKDMQRMYNYHVTTATEVASLSPKAPWIGPKGFAKTHADRWQNANKVPYPYLEYDVNPQSPNGGKPERAEFGGNASAVMQLAMIANDDMKPTLGMFDASIGNRSNETSGVAIKARQREGDTATFHFIDNRNRAVEHGGRIVLDLIPKYYNVERILRCVQDDGESYTVPVNQPVAPRKDLDQLMQAPQQPMPGAQPAPQPVAQNPGQAEGPPEWVPVPQDLQQSQDPELQRKLKAITKVFDLTVGKYDVLVTAGPSFSTRREEAAAQMMQFIEAFPQAAGLVGDLLAKNLDWPGADQFAERLKAMLPPQAAGQIPAAVQHLQDLLKNQDAQARQAVATLSEQIKQLTEKVEDKEAENRIKAYDAQTKRMSELVDAAKAGVVVTTDAQGNMSAQPPMPGFAPGMPGMGAPINGFPGTGSPMGGPPAM